MKLIKDILYIWKYEGKFKAILILFILLFVFVLIVGSLVWSALIELMKFEALYKFINN